jgi:hypothetical protein
MQIWFVTPFLIATVAWWVATRKFPEDKEKWTWTALGICSGAVIMGMMAYWSQDPRSTLTASNGTAISENGAPRAVTVRNDSSTEVLPTITIRKDRSVVAGSLQITLLLTLDGSAFFQVEPVDEIAFFQSVSLYPWGPDSNSYRVRRPAFETVQGSYSQFAFRGRVFRLGLLETARKLEGIGEWRRGVLFGEYAVIRVMDVGAYAPCERRGGIRGDAPVTRTPSPRLQRDSSTDDAHSMTPEPNYLQGSLNAAQIHIVAAPQGSIVVAPQDDNDIEIYARSRPGC